MQIYSSFLIFANIFSKKNISTRRPADTFFVANICKIYDICKVANIHKHSQPGAHSQRYSQPDLQSCADSQSFFSQYTFAGISSLWNSQSCADSQPHSQRRIYIRGNLGWFGRFRRITPAFASEMTASSFASTFAAKSKKTPGSPSQETGDDVMNNTVFTRYVQDTILFVIRQIRAPNIASQNRLNTWPTTDRIDQFKPNGQFDPLYRYFFPK